jgi:phage-related protein
MPERVFYIAWQKNKFVLLSHYTKDQNKTDPKQLKHAIKLAEDLYERFGE